jgi:hypothetical protein
MDEPSNSRTKKALLFAKRSKNFCYFPRRATQLASLVRGTGSKSFLVPFFKKEQPFLNLYRR